MDEELVPTMTSTRTFRRFLGWHSQPGRSRQRPEEGKKRTVNGYSLESCGVRFRKSK